MTLGGVLAVIFGLTVWWAKAAYPRDSWLTAAGIMFALWCMLFGLVLFILMPYFAVPIQKIGFPF